MDDFTNTDDTKRGPGRPPKAPAPAPVTPGRPETLSVRIKFDTWIGEVRLPCIENVSDDGTVNYCVVDLPYDQAVSMLKTGKAERADPLPGM